MLQLNKKYFATNIKIRELLNNEIAKFEAKQRRDTHKDKKKELIMCQVECVVLFLLFRTRKLYFHTLEKMELDINSVEDVDVQFVLEKYEKNR